MKAHSSSIVIARLILQALPPENSLKFGSIRSYFMMTVESFCQGLMADGNKPNFVPLIQNTIDRKFYTVKLMYELCNLSYIIHDYVRLICGSIFSGEKTMKNVQIAFDLTDYLASEAEKSTDKKSRSNY